MMRWIAIAAGVLLLAGAASTGGAVLWVSDGLRTMERDPAPECITPRDAARLKAGGFSADRQDGWVASALNFQMGTRSPPSLWWHLRGAAINWTYRTFWSDASRKAIFERFVARKRPCNFGPGLPEGTAGR